MHFVGGEMFWRCQIQLIDGAFQFNSILNFCLLNLSIAERRRLIFPIIIVLLAVLTVFPSSILTLCLVQSH